MKFDQYVFKGRPINVAISNPPARKNPEKQQEFDRKMTSSAGENQPRDLNVPEARYVWREGFFLVLYFKYLQLATLKLNFEFYIIEKSFRSNWIKNRKT